MLPGAWDGVGGFMHFLVPSSSCGFILLAFLSVSLFFGGSPHVTAGGRVISFTVINRW